MSAWLPLVPHATQRSPAECLDADSTTCHGAPVLLNTPLLRMPPREVALNTPITVHDALPVFAENVASAKLPSILCCYPVPSKVGPAADKPLRALYSVL